MRSFFSNLHDNRSFQVAVVILLFFVVFGIFAPLIAPHDPDIQNLRATLQPPSAAFWLGTDEYGRDLVSRLLFGARSSILIAVSVVALSGIIGTAFGIVAGFRGGWLDMVVMRCCDVMLAFPYLVLALALIAAMGPGIGSTVIALTFAFSPIYIRIVRSSVLVIKQEAYVDAARLMGVKGPTIAIRHILPNVVGPALVQGALTFAFAVLAEASLSFVGLGVPPPAASFGNIIAAGRDQIVQAPWICTASGVAIVSLVLSLLGIADGLRDAVDPHQRSA